MVSSRRRRIENQCDLPIRRTGLAIMIEKKLAEHAAHRRTIDTKLNWPQYVKSCHDLVVDLRYVHPSFSIVDNDHRVIVRYVWCESSAQSATGHGVAWKNHDDAVRRTRTRNIDLHVGTRTCSVREAHKRIHGQQSWKTDYDQPDPQPQMMRNCHIALSECRLLMYG